MRTLLVITCLAAACLCSFAQPRPTVTRAELDGKGWLHIATADHRDYVIRPKKWKAGGGFTQIVIAPDARTVGWLVNQMLTPLQGSTNYSHPIALELDIWRDGRVIRRFSPSALTIHNWIYLQNGSQVAFHTAPTHGQEFYVCDLFDVDTGKELNHWLLDHRDYVIPDWAKPLLADESLPGPDEISNWLPSVPASEEKTSPQ